MDGLRSNLEKTLSFLFSNIFNFFNMIQIEKIKKTEGFLKAPSLEVDLVRKCKGTWVRAGCCGEEGAAGQAQGALDLAFPCISLPNGWSQK